MSWLKAEFAKELVWFPVVVAIYGALATFDEPGESFVRVSFQDPLGSPGERQGGWFEDAASVDAVQYPAPESTSPATNYTNISQNSVRFWAWSVAVPRLLALANGTGTDGHRTLR